jgi:hypothetical protein
LSSIGCGNHCMMVASTRDAWFIDESSAGVSKSGSVRCEIPLLLFVGEHLVVL